MSAQGGVSECLTWEALDVFRRDAAARNRRVAARVVKGLAGQLKGREHDGVRVASLFHYGAVDIDPKNLIVWVLLEGRPDDEIPAWLDLSPTLQGSLRPEHVDYDWLLGIRSEIQQAFANADWPDPKGPDVAVDSQHRVNAGGGWNYFR